VYSQVPAMLIPAFTHAVDSCLPRETMHETKTEGACGVDICSASFIVQDIVV